MSARRRIWRSARWVALSAVALFALGVTADAGLPSIVPVLGPPGALPPQPGTPAGPCHAVPSAPGTWSTLASVVGIPPQDAPSSAGTPVPEYQIAVNPWRPCEMFRADAADAVSRSLDGGRSWQIVFKDDESGYGIGAVNPAPFHARDLQVIGPHTVAIAESANGDGLVLSHDDGASWTLADGGLQGQPIMRVVQSPSDASTLYAVAVPPGTRNTAVDDLPGLYVSRDGGATWTGTTMPRVPDLGAWQVFPGALGEFPCGSYNASACDAYPQVQVDPADAARLWVMLPADDDNGQQGDVTGQTSVLLESTDFGQTWNLDSHLQSQYTQLLATYSRDLGTRLYAAKYDGSAAPLVSTDAGSTWAPIPVTASIADAAIVADPGDPDEMAYVGVTGGGAAAYGVRVRGFYSWDGFSTSASLPPGPAFLAPVQGAEPFDSPLVDGSGQDPTGATGAFGTVSGGYTTAGDLAVQADRLGTFYLAIDEFCYTSSGAPPCLPGARANTAARYQSQGYERISPPPPPPGARATSGGASGGSGQGSASPMMQQLKQCAIPLSAGGGEYGNLAFDGEALLYTQYGDTGPQPYTGVIHRMDPSTCAPLPDLTVQFDKNDLQEVANETREPDTALHPIIDTMTYDPNHDVLWLSLSSGSVPTFGNSAQGGTTGSGPDITGIFSATFPSGPLHARSFAVATLRFSKPHCSGNFGEGEDLFTYDFSDNTLWACDFVSNQSSGSASVCLPIDPLALCNHAAHGEASHLDAYGRQLRSCIDGADSGSNQLQQISNWVLGAPGHLFVQSEDDETIFDVVTSNCATANTFVHRKFGEPTGEDEQMACDSITFGQEAVAAGGAPTTKPTSAIWLRDAINNTVVAYAVPDAVCPYPTETHFIGPVHTGRGQVTSLCATLSRAGIPHPLGEEVLVFRVNGRSAGEGYTNNAGVACLKTFVALGGGTWPVTVSFAGTKEWYASGDTGALIVSVPSAPAFEPLPAILPPLAPPAQPPPQPLTNAAPNSNPIPNPAPQPQPQTQTQGQQQAQANVQAGLNAQEQEQVQPQAAMAMLPDQQGQELGYAMSTVSPDTRDSLLGLGLGAAFAASFAAGIAWVRRAPALALRRRERSRHRR